MAINFDNLLSNDQKRNLLTQRIEQFATEAYQHELNRQIAERVNDEEAVTSSVNALNVLDNAITVHEEELASLPDGLS
jgi:hypothetical protein